MTPKCIVCGKRADTRQYCGFEVCQPCEAQAHAINAERNEAHAAGKETGRRNMAVILEELRNA